jgi:hypothetical protein
VAAHKLGDLIAPLLDSQLKSVLGLLENLIPLAYSHRHSILNWSRTLLMSPAL